MPASGVLTIRLNNGRGVFGGGQVRTEAGGGRGVAAGDVDGDGDIDLLCGNGGSTGTIYVRLNGPAPYPIITSFTPTSGSQGTTVTITGTNLSGATSVSFNGVTTTTIVNNTATSLTVQVPTGATTGYLSVTTAAGTSAPSADPFTVVPPPVISSFTPTSGPQGSYVTITGTNLTGTTVVRFNGTPSSVITNNTATSLSVQVPAGATTGLISLTNPGGTATSSASFTVTATPVLTSIVPGSAPVGGTVVLNGSNLAGTRSITFGGNVDVTSGFAVNAAGTQITGIVVPAGAVTGNVTVGFSNGLPFTVTALLTITQVTPAPLSVTAAPTAAVQVTFDQPLQSSSAGALKVFSSQRGGLRTRAGSPATAAGTALRFAPGQPFVAGEVVQATVTTAAVGTNDARLPQPRVVQYSVGVSAAGSGNFPNGSECGVGYRPKGLATGDVDGDGDIDFVAANSGIGANSVSVRLNGGDASGSNTGVFANGTTLALPQSPFSVVLGDLDGDGDLDLVTYNYQSTASIRFNDGLGNYSGSQEVTMSANNNPDKVMGGITLGDIDGDGDLDLLSAAIGSGKSLGVRFNDGTGNFTTSALTLSGPSYLSEVALGDLDNDGDLDVVAPSYYPGSAVNALIYYMLNDGAGTFTTAPSLYPPSGLAPTGVALGDIDNDGDLDFVIGNSSASNNYNAPYAANVFRNNGGGTFTAQLVATSKYPAQVALGDIDGDGDLDLLTTCTDANTVSVQLNNGVNTGAFTAGPEFPVGLFPNGLALADVDGDGDLDFLTTNKNANTVSVRRNAGVQPPRILSFTPTSGPSGTAVTITGQNLSNATSVTFNGAVTAAISNNSATSLTVTVPAGASTGFIAVTTPGGTATSSTVFTVPGTGSDYLLNNNNPLTVCAGTLYDSGGPNGNYSSYEGYQKVLTPGTTGAKLRLSFTSFTTESSSDYLLVYDGNSTSAPLLGSFSGTAVPGTLTATNGAGQLMVVFVSDRSREAAGFAAIISCVQPTPTITNLSPVSGPVGTGVTLTGTELAGTVRVTLNGADVPGFVVVNNTTITFTVPSGATSGLVSVVTQGGSASSPVPFTVTSGTAQLAVTQGGTSYPSGGAAYSFGSQPVNSTSAPVTFQLTNAGSADLTLTGVTTTGDYALSGPAPTTVPAGGSATVSVTFTPTAGGTRLGTLALTSSLGTYSVNLTGSGLALPTLASVAPTSGLVGSTIALSGTNLAGATTITFAGSGGNTVTSGFTVNAAGTQITGLVVPTGASTGAVTVTTPAGTSNGVSFVVLRDLVISGGSAANPVVIPPGDYRNITIADGAVAVFGGAVTVAGTLTVGGTLNTNCQSLTGSGSFALLAGATLGVCDAAGLSSSGSTGAVQLGGTRDYSPEANYVYNGTGAQSTGTGLPGTVRSLTTTNPQAVTLTSPVAVTQTLTVAGAGNLVLGGNALTLLASASGTALAVNSGTGSVVGTATVQSYIDGSANAGTGYRHYSAPVSNTTVADLQTSSYVPVVNGAYNTSATPVTTQPFPTVFGYDQARLATTANNLAAFDKGWYSPANLSEVLRPGQGYTVNLGAKQIVDFQGTLGNNSLTVNLARNAGATAPDAGWALVGNPYPAPLDYSLVDAADRPNLDAAIYVYQSSGPYAGNYRSYVNGQSTTGTNNPLLAIGQGFFVRVSQGQTSGSLTFRNAQRVTSYAAAQQVTFQRLSASAQPTLRLTLAGRGLTDGWVTYAAAGATPAFDGSFDAAKLPNSTGLNLSSGRGSGQLAIDGQPAFTAATVLPLAVGVPAAGTYTLTTAALDNLPAGLVAYLRDEQTGTLTALSAGTSYPFSVSATQAQALLRRFTVQFAPATPLATTPAALAAAVTLYPNPAHEQVTVALPALPGTSRVQAELLIALGQVVQRQAVTLAGSGTTFVLPTLGLASGVYVVRLRAGDLVVTKRLTIE